MRITLRKGLFSPFFLLFVFSVKIHGQITTSGSAYVWSTASSWIPSGVPSGTSTVTVNNPLTLDQDLNISTGSYTFNNDVTDQPGGSSYNLTNLNAGGSLTIASGTTTIGGITSIGGNTAFSLTVKSGAALVLGTLGSTSNNFIIGDKVNITIEQGATLIVYGNTVNSDSNGTFTVNGLFQVYGNYSTNNGNIVISGTTGQFYTTGSMTTQGSSNIYGSGNDCTTNCSGTSLECGTGGNAYTATITPQNQTICSGDTPSTLTFTTNSPSPTYQWEYSLSSGGTYTAISGATSNTYSPSSLTVTTWYRVKYTSSASSCGTKYSAPVPVYVSGVSVGQSLAGQSTCGGNFGPISVTAIGSSLSYQWYSNNTASNSGGTSISGAISNVYTPSSSTAGTKYYYCVINSSCGIPVTTAVSGAFVVNLNTVTAASSSPNLCVNTLMSSITHNTTGATGIGTVTGLPLGLNASWSANVITISGTPTESGTFNYNVPLTGGCGNISATGTIIVNSLPVITTQPTNQLECEGNSVKFKVVASGSGLTYTWKYKRLTDLSFITLTGSESNTSYPSTGEIKIDNVSSTQYPDGTQFQVVVSNGSCSVTSNTVTLSVNEITNVSGGTNVTQCYGTNYLYTVTTSYPANVVSYQWKKSVTSGVWNVVNDGGAYSGATTATLSITGGTPAESAEYRVFVTLHSSGADCNVASYTRTRKITFLPQLTTPVTTITQPTCSVNTGTVTVTVQSATDTYSFDNGVNYQASNVKSGLAVGSYNVIIKNIAGCVSSATNCQIISEISTWNGTAWINGTPDANRKIVFQQNFNSTSNLEGCSCQVTNGAKVVINGTHTLKVTDEVNVASGSLTFENNASLVQINDAAINTGTINYKRFTTPIRRFDFTYWSSPVIGQTLKNLSPNTLSDKYYGYNPNTGWVIYYNGAGTMQPGNGYSIRAPQTFSITDPQVDADPVFIGVPNNGVINLSLGVNKLYLLGNPYPSAIDADLFLDANSTVLEGTLYFWTHNTAPLITTAGTANLNYSSNDYAAYNRTGIVSTATKAVSGGYVPSGKIAAGQGFFALSSAAGGSLIFNNSMRVDGGAFGVNNSQFFKINTNEKLSSKSQIERNRVWLNLTNKEGAFKQILVGYLKGATNDYDTGFDGSILKMNQEVEFYTVNQGLHLAIQGRALPFDEKDTVILGYQSVNKGKYQISINQTDGVLDSQDIFLEDSYLNVTHNLKKEPYLFTTEKGTFNDRFVLRYTDKNTEISSLDKNISVAINADDIKLSSSSAVISKVSIYNVLGQLIYQDDVIDLRDYLIQNLHIAHQVLVVKVVLANEKTDTVKIVY